MSRRLTDIPSPGPWTRRSRYRLSGHHPRYPANRLTPISYRGIAPTAVTMTKHASPARLKTRVSKNPKLAVLRFMSIFQTKSDKLVINDISIIAISDLHSIYAP